jgi:hypothetical protein
MRGDTHVRFGGRTRETDPGQPGHRARVRPNSGRLTSEIITQDRLDIRSYIDTMRKHGVDVMTGIRDALTGNPWQPPLPAAT